MLARQIFPQGGAHHRAPVAEAGKGRASRPLQLQLEGFAAGAPLGDRQGPPVAKLGDELAELVTGIDRREGCRPLLQPLTCEKLFYLLLVHVALLEPDQAEAFPVEMYEDRLVGCDFRAESGDEILRQRAIACLQRFGRNDGGSGRLVRFAGK